MFFRKNCTTQILTCGQPGTEYGDKMLNFLHLGSGGGSGGNDNVLHDNPEGGK